MVANENFMRRYIMNCGVEGEKGFQIGNINSATETALHISFSIEKSSVESPNNAKVQIWNLSDTNLKVLDTKDCIVELKAGYRDNIALILVGNVSSAITVKDGADKMTELEIVDGLVELRDANISISLNGKIDGKDLYEHIANAMGITITFANDLTYKIFPNGFSYVGKAKNALHKVANACGHIWSIQNGILQITAEGKAISTRSYLLTGETGLIGIPKRIAINSGAETGWEIEYFLNGAINVNDVVQIKSSVINGYYLVNKITINGDNFEGDWTCTAQVLEIKT